MKANYYKQAIKLLAKLQEEYPTYSLGRHISTAFSDYGDLWPLSNKEFLFALDKYASELALDIQNVASDEYVYKIQKDAETLFENPLDEEEDF